MHIQHFIQICVVIHNTGVCIVVIYVANASENVILLTKFSISRHFTLFLILFGVKLNFDKFEPYSLPYSIQNRHFNNSVHFTDT